MEPRHAPAFGSTFSDSALLLLHAIFDGDGEPCRDLELRFQPLYEDEIGWPEFQLLPILAGKRSIRSLDNPLSRRLKGIRRLTWYKNRLLTRGFGLLLEDLRDARIRSMLLGDLVPALSLFEKRFVRPVHALTLLVDPGNASAARKLLSKHGWREKGNAVPGAGSPFLPGADFAMDGKAGMLELRWHMLTSSSFPGADRDFWERAQPLVAEGVETLIPCTTDQLIYLAENVYDANPNRAMLYVADALKILQSHVDEIDWNYFPEQLRQRCLVLPASQLFRFLNLNFPAIVPPAMMKKLEGLSASVAERLEARYRRYPCERRLFGDLPLLYFTYLRYSKDMQMNGRPRSFVEYLKAYWQVPGNLELLRLMVLLSRRRIGSRLRQSRKGGY